MKSKPPIYHRLVASFGTQVAAAKSLRVNQSTVSGWVTGKHGMSAKVARRAERVTNGLFRAAELCPLDD